MPRSCFKGACGACVLCWCVACSGTASTASPASNSAGLGGDGGAGVGIAGFGAAPSAGSGAGAAATGGSGGGGASSAASGNSSGGANVGTGSAGWGAAAGGSGMGSSAGAAGALGAAPFKGVANSPCAARSALNVSWYYNWTQKETEPCSDGKGGEFVPMIWGHPGAEQSVPGIQSSIAGFVSKSYGFVLGFNEPDNSDQANLSTAVSLSLLPGFDNTAIRVGTPATQANSTGQAWFKDYMAKVESDTGLRADFIAIHWYGWNAGSCDASASQLESYLKYAEGLPGNRPIWLTEWSCLNMSAPTAQGVLAFYEGALAVFAKHPRLQRYAWYPWTTNCELNDKNGALTPLGVAYAAAPASK